MFHPDYPPRHPQLRAFTRDDLHPTLRDAIDADRPQDALTEIHADLYTLRPFSEIWQRHLLEEVLHARRWAARRRIHLTPPNSMNNYGLILADLGLDEAMADVMRLAVAPLAAAVFPEVGGGSLDDAHGFTVEYRRGGDLDLGFHVDDSEVTLNLCLDTPFTDGDLYFMGRRCGLHRQTGCSDLDEFHYAHTPGLALLHAGKHRHGASYVGSGERMNLILWCRSRGHQLAQRGDELDGRCPRWCEESMDR